MIRSNHSGAPIIAMLLTIILVGATPIAAAPNVSACGTLAMPLDCMYFRPFSGGQFLIQNWSPFHIGDTVYVSGGSIFVQWCGTFQESAIVGNSISAGNTACSQYYPCCQGTTGNLAGNATVSLVDLARLVTYLSGGGNFIQCMGEADINASGAIDLSDLASLV
ncbi:MAG: hypothetical protein WAU88_16345, partial [Candidatus Zixiibacteriota bacterium]